MQGFLLSFLIFLSCGLNSGYTEIATQKKRHFNTVFKNIHSPQEAFKCTTDEECQTFISQSICKNNSCVCAPEKVLSSDASKCLAPASEFGSLCEDNIQCSSLLSSGGVCASQKCACKIGYHYLKGSCWKNAGLNEKCYKDEQCFAAYEYVGLKCENNLCKCRTNYYYQRLNSGCRRIRKISESCNLDDDCEEGTCESMTCSKANEVEKANNSYSNTTDGKTPKNLNSSKPKFSLNRTSLKELGTSCSEDSECRQINNTVCLDNRICACRPPEFVASTDNRECLRVTRGKVDGINQSSCKYDSQCGVFGENGYCNDKRCACRNNTYFEVETKFCWTIKALQESCSDDKDCHPSETHATCEEKNSGKKCTCKTGYHQKGSKCLPDSLGVGDPCEETEDCSFKNSFCNASNICTCKEHYYPENRECKPGVGTECVSDEDCVKLDNTECKIEDLQLNKRCLCKNNYTHSNDYKYCLPVASHKGRCEESFQCEFHLGHLGECKRNICECCEGAHYSHGKCHKSKFVSESCTKKPDCFPANDTNSVICLKGFCSCNYDYELDKSRLFCVRTNAATTKTFYCTLLTSLVLFLAIR